MTSWQKRQFLYTLLSVHISNFFIATIPGFLFIWGIPGTLGMLQDKAYLNACCFGSVAIGFGGFALLAVIQININAARDMQRPYFSHIIGQVELIPRQTSRGAARTPLLKVTDQNQTLELEITDAIAKIKPESFTYQVIYAPYTLVGLFVTPDKPNPLPSAFLFTEEDLVQNRHKKLSQRQVEERDDFIRGLLAGLIQTLFFGISFSLLAVTGIYRFLKDPTGWGFYIMIGFSLYAAYFLLLFGFCCSSFFREYRSKSHGQVMAVQRMRRNLLIPRLPKSKTRKKKRRTPPIYLLKTSAGEIEFSQSMLDALEPATPYTLYFWSGDNRILSIEAAVQV